MDRVSWRNYLFDIYNFDAPWSDVGGIYIFSGYVSETSQLSEKRGLVPRGNIDQ